MKIFSQFNWILSCLAVGELQSQQKKCEILADFRWLFDVPSVENQVFSTFIYV